MEGRYCAPQRLGGAVWLTWLARNEIIKVKKKKDKKNWQHPSTYHIYVIHILFTNIAYAGKFILHLAI